MLVICNLGFANIGILLPNYRLFTFLFSLFTLI